MAAGLGYAAGAVAGTAALGAVGAGRMAYGAFRAMGGYSINHLKVPVPGRAAPLSIPHPVLSRMNQHVLGLGILGVAALGNVQNISSQVAGFSISPDTNSMEIETPYTYGATGSLGLQQYYRHKLAAQQQQNQMPQINPYHLAMGADDILMMLRR